MYVENIVIGTPIDNPQDVFATNESDWLFNKKEKTYFTKETYLPRILVDIGIYKLISEVRRNAQIWYEILQRLVTWTD